MTPQPLVWQTDPIVKVAAAVRAGHSLLDASDTGTGKTYVALFGLRQAGKRAAVICPKSVIPQWEEASRLVGVETLFVRNVESLKAEKPATRLRYHARNWQWKLPSDVVPIVDEVHRHAGQNTDNAKILNSLPRPTLMLSRTAASSPVSLRAIGSQLSLTTWNDWWGWCLKNGCKPGTWGGIAFTGGLDEDEFVRLSPDEQEERRRPFLDKLHRQIFATGRGVRVRVADLPPGLFPENQIDAVAVPVANQRALDEAYATELAALRDGAECPLAELTRSRQLAEHMKLPAAIEMALDAIEAGHTVGFFVNFRESLEHIARALKDWGVALIHGDQTAEEREVERQRIQHDEARVLGAMAQAGGVGLSAHDITGRHPRYGIHFPGFSAVNLIQALGRFPRAGAKSNVIQRILTAAGTVEERVRQRVLSKAAAIDTLNDGDLRVG